MIKRRIYILTLTMIFLVSTTGMPLIIHYCKMMETASLQDCEMHSKEVQKSSCCESENHTSAIADSYFSKALNECCKDITVDHSVKDIFVSSKTSIDFTPHFNTFVTTEFDITPNYQTNIGADTSTPLISSNKIYLTNSILLI
jgi:hypothetical protein